MKTEDYDNLKHLCDANGFELVTESPNENDKFFVVKKKDIWEGVDFCIPNYNSVALKLPYKIVSKENGFIQVYCPYSGNGGIAQFMESEVEPSTEQSYIEQLKRIANEKFGEIKEGDRFDRSNMGFVIPQTVDKIYSDIKDTHYNKSEDMFFIGDLALYKKGKWATKLPERVDIKWIGTSCDTIRFEYVPNPNLNLVQLWPRMAVSLQDFLKKQL
jgi:hypothetical protein